MAAAAAAADAPVASPAPSVQAPRSVEELVVPGRSSAGLLGVQAIPEVTFPARLIRETGATDVAEALEAFAAQVRSPGSGEEPVLLINGQAPASPSDVEDLPPEAVAEIQVFSEQAALRLGYPADRRVVNVVLRDRYEAATVAGRFNAPIDDARGRLRLRAGALRVEGRDRTQVDLEYRQLEDVRSPDRSAGGAPRSAAPETRRLRLSGSVTRTPGDVSATASGRLQLDREEADLGGVPAFLAAAPGAPIARKTTHEVVRAGLVLSGNERTLAWSMTAAAEAGEETVRTVTDRSAYAALAPYGVVPMRRVETSAVSGGVLFQAQPARLAGGPLQAGLRVDGAVTHLDYRRLSAADPAAPSSQQRLSSRLSLEAPLTADLTAIAAGQADWTSGFDEALSWDVGGRWRPTSGVEVQALLSRERPTPTLAQVASPALGAPNARLYDFLGARGVEAIRIDGGADDLSRTTRTVRRLRLQLSPAWARGAAVSADYVDRKARDAVSELLGPTPQVEAALPDRFIRDGGLLTSFDARRTSLARTRSRYGRWGLNLQYPRAPYAPVDDDRLGAERDSDPKAEESEDDEPKTGRVSGQGWRWQAAVYHLWRFEETARIRPGSPQIDLLDGGAVGSRGGAPRHEVEFQLGASRGGWATRVTGIWRAATTVRGFDAAGAASSLRYGAVADVNLRLVVDLDEQPWSDSVPWLKGKLNIGVDNLLASSGKVTDASGRRPFGFSQRDRNPSGRTFRVTLRRRFKG